MQQDFICLMCPNGCHLKTAVLADQTFEITGNRCEKGLAFARRVLATEAVGTSLRIVSREHRPAYALDTLKEIGAFWGLSLKVFCPRVIPDGSPERTLFRVVIEDDHRHRFVLEQIPPRAYHTKMRIIKTLEFLSQKGLQQIVPYLANPEGHYIHEFQNGFWQVMPFIHGVALNREKYLYEGWRASVLSEFLLRLKESAQDLTLFKMEKVFSIKEYVHTLVRQIEKRHPELLARINPTMQFLEKEFMPAIDQFPAGFCHGDYHPLNIIWGEKEIKAVIDWEFSGIKTEIYDVANMVGCLGMEHPSSLGDDLVIQFIRQMKAAGVFATLSWSLFLEFIVALRFAWLSEWLRKADREMIALEMDYLELLIENQDKFRKAWGI